MVNRKHVGVNFSFQSGGQHQNTPDQLLYSFVWFCQCYCRPIPNFLRLKGRGWWWWQVGEHCAKTDCMQINHLQRSKDKSVPKDKRCWRVENNRKCEMWGSQQTAAVSSCKGDMLCFVFFPCFFLSEVWLGRWSMTSCLYTSDHVGPRQSWGSHQSCAKFKIEEFPIFFPFMHVKLNWIGHRGSWKWNWNDRKNCNS